MRSAIPRCFALATIAFAVAGCHGGGTAGSSVGLPLVRARDEVRMGESSHPIDKIEHVVIIVQENRSLNNLFLGYPHAGTSAYGLDTSNKKVKLLPEPLDQPWDQAHNYQSFIDACNGTGKLPGTDCQMNGFNLVTCTPGTGSKSCPKNSAYSYVPRAQVKPYWDIAQQYVLTAQMYASNFDVSSYVSHQYLIAARAGDTYNYPVINWGCPGGNGDTIGTLWTSGPKERKPTSKQVVDCENYQTLGDELDGQGLSWAFYAASLGINGPGGKTCGSSGQPDKIKRYDETGIWSSYQAVKHICYGPDWNNDVFSGPPKFITDVGKGNLRAVTWVTPYCRNSDHPLCNDGSGPSWVASLVNAVGESQFWNSTAIFILWDDPGLFYDPAKPKFLDFDGLGFRIPMLIVSPYAKKEYVSQVHYEEGSILRFIEDRFNLGQLAASDKRATSPAQDCFDFSQPPRKFTPIKASYSTEYFLHEAPDYRPPDND